MKTVKLSLIWAAVTLFELTQESQHKISWTSDYLIKLNKYYAAVFDETDVMVVKVFAINSKNQQMNIYKNICEKQYIWQKVNCIKNGTYLSSLALFDLSKNYCFGYMESKKQKCVFCSCMYQYIYIIHI